MDETGLRRSELERPKNLEVNEAGELKEVNFSNTNPRIIGRELAVMVNAYLEKNGEFASYEFIRELVIELEVSLKRLGNKPPQEGADYFRSEEFREDIESALKRLKDK